MVFPGEKTTPVAGIYNELLKYLFSNMKSYKKQHLGNTASLDYDVYSL
jgi:hypothetical protein